MRILTLRQIRVYFKQKVTSMAHGSYEQQEKDLEKGSEEISLSEAKFVTAENIQFPFEYSAKSVVVGITKSTIGKIIFFVRRMCEYTGTKSTAVCIMDTSATNAKPFKSLSLLGEMHSITSLSQEKIILAANDYLVTVSVNGNIFKRLRQTLSCECYDITYVENRLVFVYEGGLGIWNISGVEEPVIKVKIPNITQPSAFKVSAVTENGCGAIYVFGQPSLGGNLVTKFSLMGKFINAFNNLDFTNAGGICPSGDDHLFMSFPEENCIRFLVPDMSRAVKVINIINPKAVCYCNESRRLFVHAGNEKYLQVHNIH